MNARSLALSGALLVALAGCGGEDAGSRNCEESVEIEFVVWKEGNYALALRRLMRDGN